MLVKGDSIEDLVQKFDLLQQYSQEDIPFIYASKGTYLCRYRINKYITEMEVQGCTSFSCIYRDLFDMHELDDRPHEIPIWREYLALKRAADYIPHKSARQIFYSSMNWVYEYIAKMEIHQGKQSFCFYDNSFGFTDIV